ncbi:MAG: hypothetical protein IJ400_06160 [Clostridia bacterium]|nr:hypothetical protein [Clostridia bacterium]
MSTKNRIFSNKFSLVEHKGKFGLNNGKNVVLYPVYDSIWELDSFDFIIEQSGKFGYAEFDEQNETELLLPLYDVIIKKEHGLSLAKRTEQENEYFWYDTKSHTLHSNTMYIRSFREYDLFVSTKKCDYKKPPFLKKWGESIYLEIPYDVNVDILYEIPCGSFSLFVVLEERENDEYEYCLLIVKTDGRYTFTTSKKSVEKLYKTLPSLTEELKCSLKNTIWLLPRQK